VVNAAPTAQEGKRLHALVSALVGAGITGGYLASARLKQVHWQANGWPSPSAQATLVGESVLFVDPAEIPAHADVAKLGLALAASPPRGQLYELMVNLAAYTGLRWGELAALTITQIDQAARTITVDRKVVEIGGRLFTETPKNRKLRRTIYPRATPQAYPLAEMVTARIAQARAEQETGTNPPGLMFPSPGGKHWRASNFSRRVLAAAYPGRRMARHHQQHHPALDLDLAQPAPRVLQHRPVHLGHRRHRRLPPGRARQLPHHPRPLRRRHRRHPRPRPHRHPITPATQDEHA
jgi:hypothetical protein